MRVTTWNGCYDKQWGSMITSESFSHPAKVSSGLAEKIFSYGFERGWWQKNDICGDPFGGILGFGIYAAYAGLQYVGLELEAKFVDLAKQNIELHRPTWEAHGYPIPIILQGDSRFFSSIIGELSAVVTSPPYEGTKVGGNNPELEQNRVDRKIAAGEISAETAHAYLGKHHQYLVKDQYGNSPGQVGKETGETYWQAMTQVYTECHKALKPGGYLICVAKAYVKNKKRVPLPQQTLKLLIHLGFEPIERIKAMLTKESVNGGLFGEDIVTAKSRKSFFRRLCESKGSPRIDFEEILVVRK